jgi:hypothetical protein
LKKRPSCESFYHLTSCMDALGENPNGALCCHR